MNKEEAYNLKAGQEIFVKARFSYINTEEEIRCTTKETDGKDWIIYSNISNVFTAQPTGNEEDAENKPKYDPCRLFKNGDRVTPKEVNGRHPGNRGAIFTVRQDEAESGRNILLTLDGHIGSITIDAAYLELVTPVEELMPYSIGKSDYNGFVNIEKKGKIIAMIPYGKELHEHKTEEEALAAAEAERDRLNAEYRKMSTAKWEEEEEEYDEELNDDKKW